jgi:Flp pilus assembly pilin Flp
MDARSLASIQGHGFWAGENKTNTGRSQMILNKLNQFIHNFNRDESGQDLLEYALVLLAVLVAVIAGSTNLASLITAELSTINASITGLSLP